MHKYYGLLIEERLSVYLILLKITPNLMGYDFFKQGAEKIIQDGEKKFNVGVGLYNEIACDNGVKPDRVDRALRHAIDVSYKRNGLCDFERAMHIRFSMGRPSPKELLCLLAEMVNREVGKKLIEKRYVK